MQDNTENKLTCGAIKLNHWYGETKLTNKEICKRVGITRQSLNLYLRGLRMPKRKVQIEIRRVTGGFVLVGDWGVYIDG